MTDKVTCEIFVAMNEDGSWIVTNDENEALTKLGEDEGGYQCRIVKVTVKMTPPKMIEVEADIPEDAGQTVETPEVA